ncbi:hypothetical protein BJV77DRAFT_990534 [Russula vinacea]|nr:hypothetical protein BJV77DRAFT_990534 [Russula vinacea]
MMNRFCTCSCASENDYILALEVLLEATSVLMSLRHGAYNRLHVIDRPDRPNWRKCYTSIKTVKGTPNTHNSNLFSTHHPLPILFILLDFVDNNGSRIEGRTGLAVTYGGGEDSSRSVMQPYGADVTPSTQLELYTLNGTRSYEIHCDGHLIKTISFQVNTTVVCE